MKEGSTLGIDGIPIAVWKWNRVQIMSIIAY